MDNLKFAFWQLLFQAMALSNVAALIALVGSMLLARSFARLTTLQYTNGRTCSDKTLRGVD
jgi:hypothetical protein